ncbi:neuronal acetylcholine receptor subunit alpha-10-like [Lytechinus variegatus]|uniref:neuronal acetylcholine receptor subunit alpha-10-like n=1 Tax=Lytechinus variegatus TaxID=7654 RepID=UPI001BB2341F|nr:neuronal acetylcholine receptor subunit alpha-10-like [Lytechinus variegatus]
MERFPCRLPIITIACVLWTFLNLTPLCRAFEDVMRNPSKNLYQELWDAYGSPALRPVVNLSKPIVVHHRLLVSQIIDFDEPRQTLTLSSWQRMDWEDEFLAWDPSNYSGVESLEIDPSLVWKPDIQLYENVDKDFLRMSETKLLVNYTGHVTWYTPVISTSSCHIDVKLFPFDTQRCNLSFSSWIYTMNQLQLHMSNKSEATNQNIFMGNGVWNLADIIRSEELYKYDCCPGEYRKVIYTILLSRTYAFYLTNMIIPSITLCLTNTLVYLIPPESGEKVQFAVSNLLASILFQQLIATTMPPLGDELPLLGIFFLFMVMCSCFSIACSILSLRLYNKKGDEPVPNHFRKLILLTHPVAHRRLLHRVTTLRAKSSSQNGHSEHKNDMTSLEPKESSDEIQLQQLTDEENHHETISPEKTEDKSPVHSHARRRQSASLKRDVIIEEWRLLARVLDKLLFALVLVLTCLVLLGLIIEFV